MKPVIFHESTTAWPRTPGPAWVRLGEDLLFIGSESALRAERGRRPGVIERVHPRPVARTRLHVVTQIGSLFQRAHPRVPIIANKGRYLVVDLTPARARALARAGHGYSIRPLEGGSVVFDTRPRTAARSAVQPWIRDMVGRLSRSEIEATLRQLVSFPTRLSTSSHFGRAAEWARSRLEGLGFATRTEDVRVGSGRSLNLVAERPGSLSEGRGLVLVGAHLDSVNLAGGASAKAPGADDNGSGSAGLLEIARIFREHHGRHDLRLVLFGGEEQGLFGSRHHVGALTAADRARIRAVVNMDMVATVNTPSPTVLLEGAAPSQALIEALADAAANYTGLSVQTSLNPFNSDHVPFIEAGIPAVLTIEGADSANSNVHTAGDTLDHVDYDLMLEILRMNVAFTAAALEATGGSAMPEGRVESDGDIVITLRRGSDLAAALRSLPFQWSGRYEHNGGASMREGRGFAEPSGRSYAALQNPIYRLEEPVYIEAPTAARAGEELRFTLHVDVDGPDPLHVVSGTVTMGQPAPGSPALHFIGRVRSNTAAGETLTLVVEDFDFPWPQSADRITQLEVRLTGSALAQPAAEVTFTDTAQQHRHGPFDARQVSTAFREVEVDVDRETNAVPAEPCSSHVHPDRPGDLPLEDMTLESAFGRAGIRITRSPGSGTVVEAGAGADNRWDISELNDSMQLHWDAFANKPQWKMWIFLAGRADKDDLGGIMFDGEIDEPGGVDRQGTALFTLCPYFHTEAGGYIQANPPVKEAVRREVFFNLIHETGHAFNLAHSFQKQLRTVPGEGAWSPPAWMPLDSNSQALSWMNYPDSATPGAGAGANATWFYRRFRFRFDDGEVLFLRHAPESYVQMGNAAWFQNHARVSRVSLDRRLKLEVRNRREFLEQGEPVMIELKLGNQGDRPVWVHGSLDPSDGLTELAVTNPRGERRPFVPIDHTRRTLNQRLLGPKEAIYEAVDLSMGKFGFAFKEPGAYRIEASYRNLDGGTAAAFMQVYVRPPARFDDTRAVNELFHARLGRTLYAEGTRVMEDVNDRMDWIRKRLGDDHPVSQHLAVARYKPLAKYGKLVLPRSGAVKVVDPDPERVVKELQNVCIDRTAAAADTMGHIWYEQVMEAYTSAARDSGQKAVAQKAQQGLVDLMRQRNVVPGAVAAAERRLKELS